eukprot:10498563-Lingulodinium_polyedra.AAC.1
MKPDTDDTITANNTCINTQMEANCVHAELATGNHGCKGIKRCQELVQMWGARTDWDGNDETNITYG